MLLFNRCIFLYTCFTPFSFFELVYFSFRCWSFLQALCCSSFLLQVSFSRPRRALFADGIWPVWFLGWRRLAVWDWSWRVIVFLQLSCLLLSYFGPNLVGNVCGPSFFRTVTIDGVIELLSQLYTEFRWCFALLFFEQNERSGGS